MAYHYKDMVITNTALNKMRRYNITYDEISLALHYPHETEKAYAGYKGIRDFKSYKVAVVYSWDDRKKIWVVISCWAWIITQKTRWHKNTWWFSHILG
jgi:hypothetical protein